VGTATRWTAAVAAAATIVLGVDYAHALPGTTGEASGAVQHTSDGDVQQQSQEQQPQEQQPQQPQSVPGYDSQPAQTVTGAS
jgi:hypothetical protein